MREKKILAQIEKYREKINHSWYMYIYMHHVTFPSVTNTCIFNHKDA